MAARKNTSKDADQVEVVENTDTETTDVAPEKGAPEKQEHPAPGIVDGLWVEHGVKLKNGVEVTIEVILDVDDLPASFGNLMAEGNTPAMVIAQCSPRTRRILDFAGATMVDLKGPIREVVERAQDAERKDK